VCVHDLAASLLDFQDLCVCVRESGCGCVCVEHVMCGGTNVLLF